MISWIPRWKDNPNFNAQVAHFAVGYDAGITILKFTKPAHRMLGLLLVGGFFGYAILKEFWYDAGYEIPAQTFGDNFEDWLFYNLGLIAGITVGGL